MNRRTVLATLLLTAAVCAQQTFPVSQSVTVPSGTYENPLAFHPPLQRSGNDVTCPTCGGAARQFSSTATVSVTGVTSATTLLGAGAGSLTLPANFFSAPGDILHVVYEGLWDTGGTAGGADTYLLKFGSSTVILGQANAVPPATSGTNSCSLQLYLTARTVGVTGTLIGQGHLICGYPGASNGVFDTPFKMNTAATVDTTIAQNVDFQVQSGSTAHVNTQQLFLLMNY